MLTLLLRALRTHRWLRLTAGGFVLSSVGSGLTFVIVFGELLRLHAPASSLVIAYVLSTTPGFIGSLCGERLCTKVSPFAILICGEALGLLGLAFPVFGMEYHSILLLQLAECVAAFAAGMTLPAIELVFKRGLSEAELPVASTVETIVFGSNTLIGVGVGVLLYGSVSSLNLLWIDAFSYVVAALLMWGGWKKYQTVDGATTEPVALPVVWTELAAPQRYAMVMLPLLALVGAPAMALLPALAPALGQGEATLVALPLLFARSLGQLCGPFLLPVQRFSAYSKDARMLFLPLCGFLACYLLLPQVGASWLALLLVFAAHLLSNIVFALGWYAVTISFSEQQVASAAARSYRWQVGLAALASLAAGLLVDHVSATLTLMVLSGTALVITVLVLLFRQSAYASEPGR
jgi:DHA3 family macrolide efflux protein-like MFS transporter